MVFATTHGLLLACCPSPGGFAESFLSLHVWFFVSTLLLPSGLCRFVFVIVCVAYFTLHAALAIGALHMHFFYRKCGLFTQHAALVIGALPMRFLLLHVWLILLSMLLLPSGLCRRVFVIARVAYFYSARCSCHRGFVDAF